MTITNTENVYFTKDGMPKNDIAIFTLKLNGTESVIDDAAIAFEKCRDNHREQFPNEVELATHIISETVIAFHSEFSKRVNLKTLARPCAREGMDYKDFVKACKAAVGVVKGKTKVSKITHIEPWTNAAYSKFARNEFDCEKRGNRVGAGGRKNGEKLSDFQKARRILRDGSFTKNEVEKLVAMLASK